MAGINRGLLYDSNPSDKLIPALAAKLTSCVQFVQLEVGMCQFKVNLSS